MNCVNIPRNLYELTKLDERECTLLLEKIIYEDGVYCPFCGGLKYRLIQYKKENRFFRKECLECRKIFWVTTLTALHNSSKPLSLWLNAFWRIANSKNGYASRQFQRDNSLFTSTAWIMLQKIRDLMTPDRDYVFSGEVEIDEVFIGGKAKWKSAKRKESAGIIPGVGGLQNKICVIGIMERGGRVYAESVDSRNKQDLLSFVRERVEKGSTIYSDAYAVYHELKDDYDHKIVDHSTKIYTNHGGKTHTNSIENFWAHLRRALRGTYIQTSKHHLDSYIAEQAFRFNTRHLTDAERFELLLRRMVDKKITIAELTGKTDIASHPENQRKLDRQLKMRDREKQRKENVKGELKILHAERAARALRKKEREEKEI